MALRAAIARKKAEAEAKKAVNPPPIPAAAPQPASAPVAAPPSASAAPAQAAGAFEVKKGFLAQSAGALYPDGSSEAAPGCWRSSASSARPVFRITTLEDRHEVVGAFSAAGDYLGKEDFAVTRNGLALEIRGNPQGDPRSLVAGLHEKVNLPADADFDAIQATFQNRRLTITVPRPPGGVRILPPELLTGLDDETVRALASDPDALMQLLARRMAEAANIVEGRLPEGPRQAPPDQDEPRIVEIESSSPWSFTRTAFGAGAV